MTNEDIVRTSVILPMMLQMIDTGIAELQQSKQTFRPLFIRSAHLLRDKINADLVAARRELSKRGIKVIEEDTETRTAKRWKIIQSGNEEIMAMLRAEIRADIDERITAYNEGMLNVMPGPVKGDIMRGVTRDGQGDIKKER